MKKEITKVDYDQELNNQLKKQNELQGIDTKDDLLNLLGSLNFRFDLAKSEIVRIINFIQFVELTKFEFNVKFLNDLNLKINEVMDFILKHIKFNEEELNKLKSVIEEHNKSINGGNDRNA